MLGADGRGSGTCWTAVHKSPTELAKNAAMEDGNGAATRC